MTETSKTLIPCVRCKRAELTMNIQFPVKKCEKSEKLHCLKCCAETHGIVKWGVGVTDHGEYLKGEDNVIEDCDYCGDKLELPSWKEHKLVIANGRIKCLDCNHASHWHTIQADAPKEFRELGEEEYRRYKRRGRHE